MSTDSRITEILDAFAKHGNLDYGEHCSMQEHMLQCAWLAEENGESDRVVVAALLHDYGHLVCGMPNDTFEAGTDNHHQTLGAQALGHCFEEELLAAVGLHVDAKRYLCAIKPSYHAKLSPASVTTLAVQGGPMSTQEIKAFESQPGHRLAIKVRLYDDRGKLPEMRRPELKHYVTKIGRCLIGEYSV